MSIKTKIALWLAPELSDKIDDLESRCERSTLDLQRFVQKTDALKKVIDYQKKLNIFLLTKIHHRDAALKSISSLQTTNCAHVGKRMAAIANGALAHGQSSSTERREDAV